MWSRASTIVGGLLLIGLGAVLMAVNTFGVRLPFEFGQIGWPVFVIAPGAALLIIGLIASGEAGVGLAVAGGIVTTVGLILTYQSATDHWTSWAYAWALIAPTSVGASMLLWGIFHRRATVVRQGISGLGVGLVLFIVGFAFFEGVLGLGGGRGLAPLGRQALPVALIVAGVLIVLSRLWPWSRSVASYAGWESHGWTAQAGPPREGPPPVPPESPAPWASPPSSPSDETSETKTS